MKLRLVGDIHGNVRVVGDLIDSCGDYDLTIQLGDFGAGFGTEHYLNDFDPANFRVLLGNHDNWDVLKKYPHALDRFGVLQLEDLKIFYVGGAWSIDQAYRIPGLSWWESEELNIVEHEACLELWKKECEDVDLVITHDGPINTGLQILGEMPYQNRTNVFLYEMWRHHEPPSWRFGHWHKCWANQIGLTNFRCLNIDEEEVIEF
jgi:hypothetical protein